MEYLKSELMIIEIVLKEKTYANQAELYAFVDRKLFIQKLLNSFEKTLDKQ